MTEKLTKKLGTLIYLVDNRQKVQLYLCWRMYSASENLPISAFSISFKIVPRVKNKNRSVTVIDLLYGTYF